MNAKDPRADQAHAGAHATIALAKEQTAGEVSKMVVHRGVIKGNTVVLTDLPELPDGTEVEVHLRPAPPDFSGLDEEAAEDAFEQYLLRAGMIKRIPPRLPDPPGVDRTPVEIEGRPL